jgi:hypothetical protein
MENEKGQKKVKIYYFGLLKNIVLLLTLGLKKEQGTRNCSKIVTLIWENPNKRNETKIIFILIF